MSRPRPHGSNLRARATFLFLTVLFMAVFIFGIVFLFTDGLFTNDYLSEDTLEAVALYGVNKAWVSSLTCFFIFLFLRRMYTFDLLLTQDGANFFRKLSVQLFGVWLTSILICVFTDFGSHAWFVLGLAIAAFLLNLAIRPLAEKVDMHADRFPNGIAGMTPPQFFSFIDWLIRGKD